MNPATLTIVIAIGISVFVVDLIRKQKMTFKYSLFWLFACSLAVTLSYWNYLLRKISQILGFELLSNFIFFCFLGFFALLTLFLTIYINEQNTRSDLLAQAVGILEYRLKQLEKPAESESPKDASS